MRILTRFLALAAFALSLNAAAQNIRADVHYRILPNPTPAEAGAKVEVVEFFGYFCPHCYTLDPMISEWARKMGDKIVFRRVHTAFGGKTLAQQRMHLALEAMGRADALHGRIFEAVQRARRGLNDDGSIADFVASAGVDRAAFTEVYNSFSIQSKARRNAALETAYKLDGVPNLVIDGRYVTGQGMLSEAAPPDTPEAILQQGTLQVAEFLVNRILAERK